MEHFRKSLPPPHVDQAKLIAAQKSRLSTYISGLEGKIFVTVA
jgi:hypothetical protein